MKNLNPVLRDIMIERVKQDDKWSEQNHAPEWWMQILMEEVGEAAKALLEASFSVSGKQLKAEPAWLIDYRKELVQVAAVAIAAIESFDRSQNELAQASRRRNRHYG